MFNPKMGSRKKKKNKIPPQILCFFVFYCRCALKYHAAANFLVYKWLGKLQKWLWFLANVAVIACQDLATLLPEHKILHN